MNQSQNKLYGIPDSYYETSKKSHDEDGNEITLYGVSKTEANCTETETIPCKYLIAKVGKYEGKTILATKDINGEIEIRFEKGYASTKENKLEITDFVLSTHGVYVRLADNNWCRLNSKLKVDKVVGDFKFRFRTELPLDNYLIPKVKYSVEVITPNNDLKKLNLESGELEEIAVYTPKIKQVKGSEPSEYDMTITDDTGKITFTPSGSITDEFVNEFGEDKGLIPVVVKLFAREYATEVKEHKVIIRNIDKETAKSIMKLAKMVEYCTYAKHIKNILEFTLSKSKDGVKQIINSMIDALSNAYTIGDKYKIVLVSTNKFEYLIISKDGSRFGIYEVKSRPSDEEDVIVSGEIIKESLKYEDLGIKLDIPTSIKNNGDESKYVKSSKYKDIDVIRITTMLGYIRVVYCANFEYTPKKKSSASTVSAYVRTNKFWSLVEYMKM